MTAPGAEARGDYGGLLHAVESCFAAGDYVRAEQVVGAALATDPHNPRLLTAFARAKLGQSDWAAAASSAHAALSAEPQNEHTMRVYTRALEMQGRWQEALWMAAHTAATHPFSYQAHYGHARLLHACARPGEAMAAVNEALRLNPSDVDSLVLRGDMFGTLGQYGAAEADYRQALLINPQHADAVHSLAMLAHARGKRWNAVRGFLAVGQLDPLYGDVVRQNVGAVITGVLRRSAWVVLIAGFGVILTFTLHEDGRPTAIPRIVAGIGAVALIVMAARIMREVPTRTLGAVLKKRQILAIRIVQLAAGAVFGTVTALFGAMTVPAVLASVLVLSLPIVVIVGGLTGERLW
ncbi:tetratricopeptide repeat protein [Mycolicibacterium litorale]|uniref:tetratricopeptide repeat protein n=1 Tax=Mycolicibacterium litorale TaxID=758802 RepID=UPI003CF763FA